MWPFSRPRRPELWETFQAKPEDAAGRFSGDQRAFLFWSVMTSPHISKKDKAQLRRFYRGAVAVGHQSMADFYLDSAIAWNGSHVERLVRDEAYWEEYQRVMHGQRIHRVQYMVGRHVPTGDTRQWRTRASAGFPIG
jgi:hypothetical protein